MTDVFHLSKVDHLGEHAPSRVFFCALAEKQGTFPDPENVLVGAKETFWTFNSVVSHAKMGRRVRS